MRISDWSSDVCSSDLIKIAAPNLGESFMARNLPALASGGDSAAMLEGADKLPYAVPAFRAARVDVPTTVPLGYWRSVGHSYTASFCQSFVDELAHAAASDPRSVARLGVKGCVRRCRYRWGV